MYPLGWNRDRYAKRFGLRGVSQNSSAMGPLEAMPDVRTRGLLRPVARAAFHQTLSQHPASHHRRLRSAGGVGLVFHRRSVLRSFRSANAATRTASALLLTSLRSRATPQRRTACRSSLRRLCRRALEDGHDGGKIGAQRWRETVAPHDVLGIVVGYPGLAIG